MHRSELQQLRRECPSLRHDGLGIELIRKGEGSTGELTYEEITDDIDG